MSTNPSTPAPPYDGVVMPEKYRQTPYADLPPVIQQRVDAAQVTPTPAPDPQPSS